MGLSRAVGQYGERPASYQRGHPHEERKVPVKGCPATPGFSQRSHAAPSVRTAHEVAPKNVGDTVLVRLRLHQLRGHQATSCMKAHPWQWLLPKPGDTLRELPPETVFTPISEAASPIQDCHGKL